MSCRDNRIRVLYSFPHKIGADRICNTAWHQVAGLITAGAEVLVCPGVLHRPWRDNLQVWPTLARGNVRIPYKVLGTLRACALHDWIVSRRIKELAGQIDIIHTWPLGALNTIKEAAALGIPTMLERPNAHTEFAFEAVQRECARLGMTMPRGHDHVFDAKVLRKEAQEYDFADRLLCPSEFVARTFLEKGFAHEKLARHQYGFDENKFYPTSEQRDRRLGLAVLFVGECSPRKGLHYALEAWLRSSASACGSFVIAGHFMSGYADKLSEHLSHPSVQVLGHRDNVPELMRNSDVLVLPSVEEGSALVTLEARGSGCVLLVSQAAGAICHHMENALVHNVGDVQTLSDHFTTLQRDRTLLERLRAASLSTIGEITWTAAGVKLMQVYREVIEEKSGRTARAIALQ